MEEVQSDVFSQRTIFVQGCWGKAVHNASLFFRESLIFTYLGVSARPFSLRFDDPLCWLWTSCFCLLSGRCQDKVWVLRRAEVSFVFGSFVSCVRVCVYLCVCNLHVYILTQVREREHSHIDKHIHSGMLLLSHVPWERESPSQTPLRRLLQTGMWAGEWSGERLWFACGRQHRPQICKGVLRGIGAHYKQQLVCVLLAHVYESQKQVSLSSRYRSLHNLSVCVIYCFQDPGVCTARAVRGSPAESHDCLWPAARPALYEQRGKRGIDRQTSGWFTVYQTDYLTNSFSFKFPFFIYFLNIYFIWVSK